MFHTLFFRLSILYIRKTTPFIRRIIEFSLLVKSLFCLFLLVMVRVFQTTHAPMCLPKDVVWNTNGILRIEVAPNVGPNYKVEDSYHKEELLQKIIQTDP